MMPKKQLGLAGGVGQVIHAADDMGDAHVEIVHHHQKVKAQLSLKQYRRDGL